MLPRHTPRLVLRRFAPEDAAAFRAYRSDPAVARYQGWDSCSEEEAIEFVRRQSVQPVGIPGEWLQIAIALKATNELIGDCALKVHAHDPQQATLGGTFARSHQRRGYVPEAFTCLLDMVFLKMNLHRVIADTDVENTAAWKLMERLGLRREGHLHQSLWFKGRWADEYLYAILREEWLARRTTAGLATRGLPDR
jgi:RimJ/RimL family protein N-acetyltransferase